MKSYETLKEYVCVDCQSKTNYKIVVNQLTAIIIISLLLEPLFVVSPAASDSGHFYHLKTLTPYRDFLAVVPIVMMSVRLEHEQKLYWKDIVEILHMRSIHSSWYTWYCWLCLSSIPLCLYYYRIACPVEQSLSLFVCKYPAEEYIYWQ